MKTKICTKCKKEKPDTREYFTADKHRRNGLRCQCKECRNEVFRKRYKMHKKTYCEKQKIYLKTERGKDAHRRARLKYCYGITVGDYNKLFQQQNGCCTICGRHQSELNKRLAIDHDHDTGKIRSLLCSRCNQGIGLFGENVTILKSAINYLNEAIKVK